MHAGSKYMAQLMERYFKDAKFDEQNRTLFAFASYNAGPGNLRKMRKLARSRRGSTPTSGSTTSSTSPRAAIGQEPVQYVRNIYKYYVAYKLAQEVSGKRKKALEQVQGGGAQ